MLKADLQPLSMDSEAYAVLAENIGKLPGK
jgi:hypothetical protein